MITISKALFYKIIKKWCRWRFFTYIRIIREKALARRLVRSCVDRATKCACACVEVFTSNAAQTIDTSWSKFMRATFQYNIVAINVKPRCTINVKSLSLLLRRSLLKPVEWLIRCFTIFVSCISIVSPTRAFMVVEVSVTLQLTDEYFYTMCATWNL